MLVRRSRRSFLHPESVMNKRLYSIVTVLVLTTACKDWQLTFDIPAGSGNWLTEQRVQADPSEISVMTQNLYVGADVDLVIRALGTADPADDFPALLFAIETVGKTDFPARAAAIADQIARARPHAVGLQEVSRIDIDLSRPAVCITSWRERRTTSASISSPGWSAWWTMMSCWSMPIG